MLQLVNQNSNTDRPAAAASLSPTGQHRPKRSEQKPSEFLLGIAKRIYDIRDSEAYRQDAQDIQQMSRRHRGQTPADRFGFWKSNLWCESPKFDNLHGTNIFQMLIRGAEANFVQTEIRLDISANNPEIASSRAVERICRDIYELLDERQWTETVMQAVYYAMILKLNAFLITRFDKKKGGSVAMPEFQDATLEESGKWVCSECYATGDFLSDTELKCPECGNTTLTMLTDSQHTSTSLVSFSQMQGGEPELIIEDGLGVSVGGADLKPADITSAAWVEWRYLADREQIKAEYPHLKLQSAPDWSYQTRLKIALHRKGSGESFHQEPGDKDAYEVRQIWLDKTEYSQYVSPVFEKIGNVSLNIGESLIEKFPDGIVMGLIGNEIAFIDNEDKNKRISSALWLSDGNTFSGLGAKAGLAIQRKINLLDNITMEGEARSLKGSLLYDPAVIDGAKLEGANVNIPKRLDAPETPLGDAVMPLKVEGLSQESLLFQGTQKQIMQEIMGVPDVVLGQNTSNDATYSGQALRSRNALGLLVPAAQSLARARELSFGHQLDVIQKYCSPESLYQLGLARGAKWLTVDDLQAFFDADLDSTITISYVPGSEVPESRFDKQMRLRQDVVNGFIPMTPEIAARIANESQYGSLDPSGFDRNQELAEKRLTVVREFIEADRQQIEMAYQMGETQLTDPLNGQRLTDEMGNKLPNPVVVQILTLPELQIRKNAENHGLQKEYWARVTCEMAASSRGISPVLIDVAEAMIAQHMQAAFALDATANALTSMTALPGQAMQNMASQKDESPLNGKRDDYARR